FFFKQKTAYEIILSLRETARGLIGSCIYQPHLFGSKRIDRLLGGFQKILEQMASAAERRISTIRFARKVSAKRVTTLVFRSPIPVQIPRRYPMGAFRPT